MDDDEGGIPSIDTTVATPAEVEDVTTVIPDEDSFYSFNDFFFWMPWLVDTWWKILVISLVGALILLLCCYCFRCCYFLWDCCSDPYWGYCPCLRTEGCEYCCKLRFCTNVQKSSSKRRNKRRYDVPEDEQSIIISEKMIPTVMSSTWKEKSSTIGSKTNLLPSDEEVVDITYDEVDKTYSTRPATRASREALPQQKDESSLLSYLGIGRRKRSYALDSGVTSANVSFDDAASCKSYKSIIPKNDIELVAVQTSGRYPTKLQKTIQELSAPRVLPLKEEDEDFMMYSSTPVSLSLPRSTPTPFKSIRPHSRSLIPSKAIPESLNTTRTSSYNEDTGSLLEHDSVHLMLFGKETIL